jgi:hypothetical protein
VDFNDVLAWFSEGRALEASVLVPHEAPIAGRLIALGDASLELCVAATVALPVGERVRLELSLGGERAAVVRAVVSGREEASDGRRYQFRMTARPELEASSSGPPSRVERRRSERFRFAVPLKIGLYVPYADGSRDEMPNAFGMLDGASREGCSFVVDAVVEHALVATPRVLLEIRRGLKVGESGTTAVWRVAACITHRRLTDDGDVRFGCMLDAHADLAGLFAFLLGRELEDAAG